MAGATFLGSEEDFSVGAGQLEDTGQPTNIVDCVCLLMGPPL